MQQTQTQSSTAAVEAAAHISNLVKLHVCSGPFGDGVGVVPLVVLLPVPLTACISLLPAAGGSLQVQFDGGRAHDVALRQVWPVLPPHSLHVMLYHWRYFRLPSSALQQCMSVGSYALLTLHGCLV